MRYADIIIDINHGRLDKSFQYRIPSALEGAIHIGTAVEVPFGKGKGRRNGLVIGLSDEASIDSGAIKDILSVNEKNVPLESQLIKLAGWMRQHYGGTMVQSLTAVLPVRTKVQKKNVKTIVTARESSEESKVVDPPLNATQQKAVDRFIQDYRNGVRKQYLLYGVTGSGKTRVYMEMMEEVLSVGKSVIVLIPEIALSRQNIQRFGARFGQKAAVLHSRLSKGERYDVYERAKNGEIQIVLGPRSALFVPFADIGLIIVDEEHETSYKSDKSPKYHAREVAIERANMAGASVVLGSATPSVDSLLQVSMGQMQMLRLPHRVLERPLPKAFVVDMREELQRGNRSMISDTLRLKLEERLQQGEQSILFLNRRGLASFVSCRSCGTVQKCPHCDVSLHQHQDGTLRCHYCGFQMRMPKVCPVCSSAFFGGIGAGTQQIEGLLKINYPKARILRMDADSTRHKRDYDRILETFSSHEADILLGTQMIVKGHDFSGVTLVGILLADMSLHGGDYSGAERTFDLIVQASGRAGRGEQAGEVVIQTYQPEHYAIAYAAKADVLGFARRELSYRRLMQYPPVGHMLLIQIQADDEAEGQQVASEVYQVVIQNGQEVLAANPTEAVISKIKDRFRYAVYVKSRDYTRLIAVKDYVTAWFHNERTSRLYRKTAIFFDFDPIGVF